MTIHIKRDDIFLRVKMTTAYLAVNHDDAPAVFDRIAAADADDAMLQQFWHDVCEETTASLRSWLGVPPGQDACQQGGGACYEVTLALSPLIAAVKQPSIVMTLQALMTSSMLSRWTAVTVPESENRYAAETETWRCRLARLLSFRPHPRPLSPF